ncbi:glycoside hydrolase family 172 protein [Rubellicoccus peritrichatus]|uniref:Glycoside hydrolase family 172 protein n=1 Tax=Rubellicoccus peritrichatus TaxID=3080537 RepID=A0AAQ3LBS3_9BACT|nr:glycoside hydrolase family 172 protein [Puniceicoccus sp. CR14]WOO41467.1 glycoside hydrolase family 172 protein [Puniceicoccus sp. CR14]
MNHSLNNSLGTLAYLSNGESRSISSENPNGKVAGGGRALPPGKDDPGGNQACRELSQGWKVSPNQPIKALETFTIADIEGPGCVQSIWMTTAFVAYRDMILRIYYDDQEHPSVECPLGDFYASAFTKPDRFAQLNSQAVCLNPGSGFNCFWPMPFRKRFRMTLENRNPDKDMILFYQVNYSLEPVPDNVAYFHAQFRRVNPVPYERVYTIVDGLNGQGHYAGTYLAWGVNNAGWWGEGEIKFYIDDDIPEGVATEAAIAEHGGDSFPTICGTGTEDYFGGSYNFEDKQNARYQEFSTPYMGVPHVMRPDGLYDSQLRFSMYRWHIPDPIRFRKRLAVTIQALGWRSGGRYLPLRDDIASVAYWYQTLPTAPFPELLDRDCLEII